MAIGIDAVIHRHRGTCQPPFALGAFNLNFSLTDWGSVRFPSQEWLSRAVGVEYAVRGGYFSVFVRFYCWTDKDHSNRQSRSGLVIVTHCRSEGCAPDCGPTRVTKSPFLSFSMPGPTATATATPLTHWREWSSDVENQPSHWLSHFSFMHNFTILITHIPPLDHVQRCQHLVFRPGFCSNTQAFFSCHWENGGFPVLGVTSAVKPKRGCRHLTLHGQVSRALTPFTRQRSVAAQYSTVPRLVHSLVRVSPFVPSLNLWFSALPRECTRLVA